MEIRPDYAPGSKKLWGERVYLIGGGPSLIGFPFEKLCGRTVLAVNDAMLSLSWATAVFSVDRQWASKRQDALRQFEGEVYLAMPSDVADIPGAVYLERDYGDGLSLEWPRVRMGGTSGYGAVNLAVLKGGKQLVLLGYDYSYRQGQSHWFPTYPWFQSGNERYMRGWAGKFLTMTDTLKRIRVQVVTAGEGSRITAFPKVPLTTVLQELEADNASVELFR